MTRWSRRTFIASAGTLAATGGAGAAAAGREGHEVPLLQTYVAGSDRRALRKAALGLRAGTPLRLVRSTRTTTTPARLPCGRKTARSWATCRASTTSP